MSELRAHTERVLEVLKHRRAEIETAIHAVENLLSIEGQWLWGEAPQAQKTAIAPAATARPATEKPKPQTASTKADPPRQQSLGSVVTNASDRALAVIEKSPGLTLAEVVAAVGLARDTVRAAIYGLIAKQLVRGDSKTSGRRYYPAKEAVRRGSSTTA